MSKDVIVREEEFFMNQRKEIAEVQRGMENSTSRSKVEFSEKEKEEAHEEPPERSTDISPRKATELEIPQEGQDVEDLSNYTLTNDRQRMKIKRSSKYA